MSLCFSVNFHCTFLSSLMRKRAELSGSLDHLSVFISTRLFISFKKQAASVLALSL